MRLRPHLTASLAGLALLGACSATPATHFYTLSAVAAVPPGASRDAAARSAKPVTLVIQDLRLPQYLDRPQIVSRGSDHRLRLAEHRQWAGNLRDDMTRVLSENLGRLLPGDRVIAAPFHMALQPEYRIAVEVLRFEREAGGGVKLAARWWLTRGADGALLASPEASFAGPAIDEDAYEPLVASMNAVFAEMAQAIARGIRAHEAGKP